MEKTTVMLVTLVVYNLVLVGIGVWAQGKIENNEDFFLGGRGLGPVVAATSYSASASSAWALLGLSGAAYLLGISALWLASGSVVGMLITWFWIAPRMMAYSREHDLLTLTDFIAHGSKGVWRKTIVLAASFVVLVSFAFYVAVQFQGAGATFSTAFGISLTESVVLGGGIVLIYTFLGGFWAVCVTDTVQGILMAITAIMLPVAALNEVGGFTGFYQGLAAVSTPAQLSWSSANAGLVAIGLVVGALSIGLGTFGQPHLLVRLMALRDGKSLRQARLLTVFWYMIVYGGMVFLGLAGHILSPNLENGETIFFVLMDQLFSPVPASILLAAVLSAIMSTADSQLLVAASSVTHDMGLERHFANSSLFLSRLAIALLVALSIVLTLYLPETIFNRALFAWGALGSAFGPLVLLRLAGIDITPMGVLSGITTGFLSTVLFYQLPDTPGDVLERFAPFAMAMIVLLLFRRR
ncbi:MAG: sodium/proline symporter [Gammaproteobacteria bacterium]